MGFFDSKSSTTTTNVVETSTFNNIDYGGGDTTGSQLLGKNINLDDSSISVGDINYTSTDYGAIQGGIALSAAALDANKELTGEYLGAADSLFMKAYGDVEDSRELTQNIAQQSFDANEYALQFIGQNVEKSFAAANQLAKSENAELTEKIMKYGMIGLGVVVVVVVGSSFVKRGR